MNFKKAIPGQPLRIAAADWNAAMQAATAHQQATNSIMAKTRANSVELLQVANATSNNLPRFAAVQVSGIISHQPGNLVFRCQLANDNERPFFIVQEPLKTGQIGSAVITGLAASKINITDESHWYAQPQPGQQYLQSCENSSARIVWAASGTGLKDAVVNLSAGSAGSGPGGSFYRAKITSNLSLNPSVPRTDMTCDILHDNNSVKLANVIVNILPDRTAVLVRRMRPALARDKIIIVSQIDGQYYVVNYGVWEIAEYVCGVV
jgi:hypothetical protein